MNRKAELRNAAITEIPVGACCFLPLRLVGERGAPG